MMINEQISPLALRDFLKARGWQTDPKLVEKGFYALKSDRHPRRQLVFPTDDRFDDFQENAINVLGKLAELEEKSIEGVFAEFSAMEDDTIAFRVVNRNRDKDYIPLSYALNAMNGAKRMLQAAACSVSRPQVHHPRMNRKEAVQLVEKSKFRHTQSGSFVLQVSSPVRELGAMPFSGHTTFVRQSFTLIHQGSTQIVNAIQSGTEEQLIESLRKQERPAVSSNLCEAITCFRDENEEMELYLNFRWSSLVSIDNGLTKSIRIPRDFYPKIEDIRRELRKHSEEDEDDVFIGTVKELAGDLIDDDRKGSDAPKREGTVILDLYDKDEEVSIRSRTYLKAEWHDEAIQAYRRGSYVKIKGVLLAGNQPRTLDNVKSFSIIKEAGE